MNTSASARGIIAAVLGLLLLPVVSPDANAAVLAPDAPVFARSFPGPPGANSLVAPKGVASLPGGGVVVADASVQRIVVLDANGDFVRAIGGVFGSAPGQFEVPSSVAVTSGGDILVVDTFNSRVQRFTSAGSFLQQFGISGPGQLYLPSGIAVLSSGDILVVDQGNHRVVHFAPDGSFVLAWGQQGSGAGEFNSPSSIAVSRHGNVYVTDVLNSRVQEFTARGAWLRSWGSSGIGPGQFTSPTGIAVDALGSVYVTESGNRVQRFSERGVWLATFAGQGSQSGLLTAPKDLAVDGSGSLLIADQGNHAIEKYSLFSQPPSSGVVGAYLDSWQFTSDPLAFPDGVAADASGGVFVLEGRLIVYHVGPQGQSLNSWPASPDASYESFRPKSGIAFHDGRVYVTDPIHNQVRVFAPDGTLLTQWGTAGSQLGQLDQPSQVRVDEAGIVYVLNGQNNSPTGGTMRVDRFTPDGTFLSRTPVTAYVGCIDVGASGDLWSFSGPSIQHYSPGGTLLSSWPTGLSNSEWANGGPILVTPESDGPFVSQLSAGTVRRYSSAGALRGQLALPNLPNGIPSMPYQMDDTPSGDILVCDYNRRGIDRLVVPATTTSLLDVPDDDGSQVTLRFLRSSLDAPFAAVQAAAYEVYRKLDGTVPPDAHPAPTLPGWELVATIPPAHSASYELRVPTRSDLTPGSRWLTTFLVRTRAAALTLDSDPITGYSHDDLPPDAPVSVAGVYAPEGVHLHWLPGVSPGSTYRIHHGADAAFEADESTLIATVSDTAFVDPGAADGFYAIVAADAADNWSAAVRLGPLGVLGVPGPSGDLGFALRPMAPNPARGDRIAVDFSLAGTAPASLELFDTGGRLLLAREVGGLGAGSHSLELRPVRSLPPGLYMIRLRSRSAARNSRLVVVR